MREMAASSLQELARLERGGLTESIHHGIAVLVDPRGEILSQAGDSGCTIYPRSAIKPIQALAMQRLGLKLSAEESVISMASHYATPRQVELVEGILRNHGLSSDNLGCPADLPWNPQAREGARPLRQYMNCSGKHAGFLATCQVNGWDLASYLEPSHPLQLSIKDLLADFAGEEIEKTTVDGCGAPLFALSVVGLARAISRFQQSAQDLVGNALTHPNLIGDTTTPDAAFLRAGLFSKLGAEGVFTVATQSSHAIAIKIADGSLRAAAEISLALLEKHSLISQAAASQIRRETEVRVLGGSESVGRLVASFS